MKTLILSLFTKIKEDAEKVFQIDCCYLGEKDGAYVFTDEMDNTLMFNSCNEAVLIEFNLNSSKAVGRNFKLTYVLIEDDDYEEAELEIIKMEES